MRPSKRKRLPISALNYAERVSQSVSQRDKVLILCVSPDQHSKSIPTQ